MKLKCKKCETVSDSEKWEVRVVDDEIEIYCPNGCVTLLGEFWHLTDDIEFVG